MAVYLKRAKSPTTEQWAAMACVLFFCFQAVRLVINTLFGGFLTLETAFYLEALLVFVPVVVSLLKSRRIDFYSIAVVAVVLVLFAATLFIHPEYESVILHPDSGLWAKVISVTGGVLGFYFIRKCQDSRTLYKAMKIVAIVLFLLYFWRPIEVLQNGYWTLTREDGTIKYSIKSMSFSYNILMPVLLMAAFWLREKKIIYLACALFGFFEILVFGSRGSIVCCVLFIALYILFIYSGKMGGVKAFFVALLIVLVGIIFTSSAVLQLLINLLDSIGVSSRSLNSLLSGDIADSNGRFDIWINSISLLSSNGYLGCGIFADQYNFGRGDYTHNIFIELLVDFGLLVGSVLILLLIAAVCRTLCKCGDNDASVIFIAFCSYSFGYLFFSSSLWYCAQFWGMLGLISMRSNILPREENASGDA